MPEPLPWADDSITTIHAWDQSLSFGAPKRGRTEDETASGSSKRSNGAFSNPCVMRGLENETDTLLREYPVDWPRVYVLLQYFALTHDTAKDSAMPIRDLRVSEEFVHRAQELRLIQREGPRKIRLSMARDVYRQRLYSFGRARYDLDEAKERFIGLTIYRGASAKEITAPDKYVDTWWSFDPEKACRLGSHACLFELKITKEFLRLGDLDVEEVALKGGVDGWDQGSLTANMYALEENGERLSRREFLDYVITPAAFGGNGPSITSKMERAAIEQLKERGIEQVDADNFEDAVQTILRSHPVFMANLINELHMVFHPFTPDEEYNALLKEYTPTAEKCKERYREVCGDGGTKESDDDMSSD